MTHPKYGQRFTCFQCEVKFFDLNKPKPICPKCGADQKKAPKKASSRSKIVAPIDFDEAPEEESMEEGVGELNIKPERDERFDPDHDHISLEDMPDEEV